MREFMRRWRGLCDPHSLQRPSRREFLSLFGCRVEHAGPGTASEQVELTYWPAPNQQKWNSPTHLLRRWNALHPDIHVSMQPIPVSQSTEEVLLAAICREDERPISVRTCSPAAMAEYAQAGGNNRS